MRKIKLNEEEYKGISLKKTMLEKWAKNFLHDTSKFIGTTHLTPEDLHKEFQDTDGVAWKILGNIDGREMACENISNGEICVWDRWEVSLRVHPEQHAKINKKVEYIFPKKKRATTKKQDIKSLTPIKIEKDPEAPQMDLFGSSDN